MRVFFFCLIVLLIVMITITWKLKVSHGKGNKKKGKKGEKQEDAKTIIKDNGEN